MIDGYGVILYGIKDGIRFLGAKVFRDTIVTSIHNDENGKEIKKKRKLGELWKK